MRLPLIMIVGAALAAGQPASAQDARAMVRSERPEAVSVTVYREPGRTSGEVDLDWLQGFALITETRTVILPAGKSTVRFEGVAEGMVAVSAVVTGLPGGVVQKNRDANLLGPASLLDGTLGNHVRIKRTNPVTGAVREEDAIVRSGSGGAVVLQTSSGFEALRCSGLPEGLVYDRVPDGLVPVPVLSVDTVSHAAQRVTVTLTYLATGFDWGANYVAEVDAAGNTMNLFAWLTVANSNGESFPDAAMQAVAGNLNQEEDYRDLVDDPPEPELSLQCWAIGSGRDDWDSDTNRYPPPQAMAPPPPPAPMAMRDSAEEIVVVTGSRIAQQEELGDLKLYRVPMPVTIAANAQKQVALLTKDAVAFERIAKAELWIDDEDNDVATNVIRLQNRTKDGLGVPLPSGGVAFYQRVGDARLLAGMGEMRDRAIGEEVDIEIGEAPGISVAAKEEEDGRFRVTVSNANPDPRRVEVALNYGGADSDVYRLSDKLVRKDGVRTWIVTVPANATRALTYRYRAPKN
ncbi:hypothetical protein FSZ31_00130 [Sphingorhabdus soli]|uniref:DUF4139 domain-containing protein n=1 Tax=Flavisphingopyxis soli TaxID=2601267 RepID=A0A5C6UM59_9SPHN|nr:hypothetical protein [Sphingorhabdus soli]TXC73216.1 hypothetical protein FSZ31_00130 [Sphingorhabdus soli]